GDTDGDGDLDLVVGVIGGLCVTQLTPTENLTFFHNTGTPEAPDFERVTTDLLPSLDRGRRSVPAFADLDGDGDLDMVVGDGNTDANLALYTNVGASGAPRYSLTDADWLGLDYDFGGYAPVFGDLDADGDFDLLVGGFNGRMAYLENTGSATAPEFIVREQRFGGIDAGQYAKPTLADVDGDGDLDLALGESNGRVFLYRNTGSPEAPAFTTASNGTPGDADLAFRDAIGLPNDVGQESSPAFADLDSDGDLDVLLGSSTGEIQIFRNAGTPEAPQFEPAGSLSGDRLTTVPRAADVTGDGVPEIISGTDSGGLLYWANTYSTAAEPVLTGALRLDAYPNPSSGDVRIRFGSVVRGELVVRDALGREVQRFPVMADEATWDGRTASGDDAPAGAYWLVLDSDPALSARVTLAR
ncbi:MAG: FG-GAP-like repeat-containing protein, partial [Bacteroidota bacterium]